MSPRQKKLATALEIAEVRFNAGAVTELDVSQARALLRSTEATIPGFETDIRRAKNALAILLGKLPGAIEAMLGGNAAELLGISRP